MTATTDTPTRVQRIHAAFQRAQQEGRAALIPYMTAGYPDQDRFPAIAQELLKRADLLEIGLPYSDPLGDGPVIQKAGEQAIAAGTSTRRTLQFVKELRPTTDVPLLVMTYINPVYAVGPEEFMRLASEAGVDGLILPDLPPDQDDEIRELATRHGLGLTFLIAPTSTPARVQIVTEACTAFVYAVSVTGVTGARDGGALNEVPALVALARQHTRLPVAVGFGVKDAATARKVAVDADADGVVVGSAFIAAVQHGQDLGALADDIRSGCRKDR